MAPAAMTRVLVVDDEVAVLGAFQRSFRKHFESTLASDSRQALELLQSGDFDVILVDYAMPGLTGIELLGQVAALRPDLPRLLVTAHHGLPEVRQAEREGLVAGVIAKPWTREDVLQLISSLVG